MLFTRLLHVLELPQLELLPESSPGWLTLQGEADPQPGVSRNSHSMRWTVTGWGSAVIVAITVLLRFHKTGQVTWLLPVALMSCDASAQQVLRAQRSTHVLPLLSTTCVFCFKRHKLLHDHVDARAPPDLPDEQRLSSMHWPPSRC